MHAKLNTAAAAAIALVASFDAVHAQVSTASLFPVGFQDDGLQGQVAGAGADGTTYVLSGTFGTFDIPYTMTLVEDATHVSEGAIIATALETLHVDVQCGIAGANAVCTEQISDAVSTTTIVESGAVEFVPVPIASGTGVITSASSASTASGSASITFVSGTTTAGVGQSTVSVLPPILSTTTSAGGASSVATVISGTALNPSATAASGASRVVVAGLAMALPLLALVVVV